MASTASRKLKRKSEAFYSRREGGEGASEATKRKRKDPTLHDGEGGVGVGAAVRGERCGRDFFDRPCEDLAKALLGCVLVRVCEGEECRGRVVETEAYLGGEDRAAHSYNGHRTERNEAIHGDGAAVLLRALEPVGGLEWMKRRRKAARKERDLCNGPAKLCQAMGIDRSYNKVDLVSSQELWVERDWREVGEVVSGKRIGIEYAGEEWSLKPLRFYLQDSPFVSKH